MATPAELLTGNPLATIESLATTGNPIVPRGSAAPAATGQIVPSNVRPIKNVTGTATTVRPTSLPGATTRAPVRGALSRAAGGLVKGGIVSAFLTPNTMGDGTISGAANRMRASGASEEEIGNRFGKEWMQPQFVMADSVQEFAQPTQAVQQVANEPTVQLDRLGDEPVNFNVQPAPPAQGPEMPYDVQRQQSQAPQDVVGYGTMQNADGTFTAMLPYAKNASGFATEEEALAAIDANYAENGIDGRAEADRLMAQDEVNPMSGLQSFVGNDDGTVSKDGSIMMDPVAQPEEPVTITPEIANAITRFSQAKYLGEQDEARAAAGRGQQELSRDPVELRMQARDQQASYEAFKESGKQMTQAQVDAAYENAKARGASFSIEDGYSDSPQAIIKDMGRSLAAVRDASFEDGWVFDAEGREELDEMLRIVNNYPKDGRQDRASIAQLSALVGKLANMEDVPDNAKETISYILSTGLSSGVPTGVRPTVQPQNESALLVEPSEEVPTSAAEIPRAKLASFIPAGLPGALPIDERLAQEEANRARVLAMNPSEATSRPSAFGGVTSFLR